MRDIVAPTVGQLDRLCRGTQPGAVVTEDPAFLVPTTDEKASPTPLAGGRAFVCHWLSGQYMWRSHKWKKSGIRGSMEYCSEMSLPNLTGSILRGIGTFEGIHVPHFTRRCRHVRQPLLRLWCVPTMTFWDLI